MKIAFLVALGCAFLVQPASAQDIPRIKARILGFDGKTLSITSGTAGQSLSVGLMPSARAPARGTRAIDVAVAWPGAPSRAPGHAPAMVPP